MSWIKNLLVLGAATLLPVLLFVVCDLAVGLTRLEGWRSDSSRLDKNYSLGDGWYELRSNFREYTYFGSMGHFVITDDDGFRISGNNERCLDNGCPQMVFLGDSFTFGVNGAWDQTFVGMFSKRNSNYHVINGGNGSYSATPYIYIYDKISKTKNLLPGHKVVIGVDISDVQDEAGYWEEGREHPIKMKWQRDRFAKRKKKWKKRYSLSNYLPYTHAILGYVKYDILGDTSWLNERSAFTYKEWHELDGKYPQRGYKPLGVQGGLDKLRRILVKLIQRVQASDGEAWILIYPWPAQLYYANDPVFSWEKYIDEICEKAKCAGVINAFPVMREYAKKNKRNWYSDLYVTGDMHFNEKGNSIIAEELFKALD